MALFWGDNRNVVEEPGFVQAPDDLFGSLRNRIWSCEHLLQGTHRFLDLSQLRFQRWYASTGRLGQSRHKRRLTLSRYCSCYESWVVADPARCQQSGALCGTSE